MLMGLCPTAPPTACADMRPAFSRFASAPYVVVCPYGISSSSCQTVCRKEDPNDRRNKLVFLTPAGEEFKEQIRPVLD